MAKLKAKTKAKKRPEPAKEKEAELPPATRQSDEPAPKQDKWINRQRVMVFASRGINHRHRHLMEDVKRLMPHHKPESKMERCKNLFVVNELCEMKNCNKALMFEGRKKKDLYMWCANIPNGPSAKFLVENLYTMGELKFTGNCLCASRPILSFDKKFSEVPYLALLKELFVQTFGVPKHHPKSQPFIDHVYSFTVLDNRIWFRNYQIVTEDGALAEVGPRFVLNPVKIFSGSFGGSALWENPNYISPSRYRHMLNKKAAVRYENKIQQKAEYEASKPKTAYPEIDNHDLFQGDPLEKAKEVVEADKKSEQEAVEKEAAGKFVKMKKVMKPKKPKRPTQKPAEDAVPKKKFAIKRKDLKGKYKQGKKNKKFRKSQKSR